MVQYCVLALLLGASAAQASSSGAVALGTVNYLGSSHSEDKSGYSSLEARWQGHAAGPIFEVGSQAQLLLDFRRAGNRTGELSEIYAGTSPRLGFARLSVGRKLEDWNLLDQRWSLGIWQPRFRWDYLRPETVGLTGAFLTVERPVFRLVAFGSPLYVPERGAPMNVNGDGGFSSVSPWFIDPPTSMSIMGTPTPIAYRLALPSVQEVVSHPSAGVRTRIGEKEGLWGAGAYAYKPMNQLPLGFEGYYNHATGNADVTLHPRVAYHHVASLEAGFAGSPVGGWVSVLNERPVRDVTPAAWTTQELSPSLAVSSSLDVDLVGKGERATRFDLSYLRQWGGTAPDAGPYATAGKSKFDSRYPYQNAVSVGLRGPLPGRRVDLASRVLYDLGHEGTVFSADVRFRPHRSWQIGVGADILSSPAADRGSLPAEDFIGRYRANDRVHTGVTYAF